MRVGPVVVLVVLVGGLAALTTLVSGTLSLAVLTIVFAAVVAGVFDSMTHVEPDDPQALFVRGELKSVLRPGMNLVPPFVSRTYPVDPATATVDVDGRQVTLPREHRWRLDAYDPGAGSDGPGATDSLALPADHPAVERTPASAAGRAAYETRVDGRVVTAAAVPTDGGERVRVATPLRVTRPGVGFVLRERDGVLVTVEDGPDEVQVGRPADLVDGVRESLADLPRRGDLTVDDRLGTVAHVVDRLDGDEQFRAQATAVVAVARAVERAADGPEATPRDRPTEREQGD